MGRRLVCPSYTLQRSEVREDRAWTTKDLPPGDADRLCFLVVLGGLAGPASTTGGLSRTRPAPVTPPGEAKELARWVALVHKDECMVGSHRTLRR